MDALTIKKICEISSADVVVKDNGNGAVLISGHPQLKIMHSNFADYCFEAISIENGKLVLWVAHDDED